MNEKKTISLVSHHFSVLQRVKGRSNVTISNNFIIYLKNSSESEDSKPSGMEGNAKGEPKKREEFDSKLVSIYFFIVPWKKTLRAIA